MKVLIVDDDLLVCRAFARDLIRGGHASRTATSVESALALIESEQPAAVLTDLDLGPGGNGVDLIARLRKLEHAPPAILMTGSEPHVARGQLARAGLDDIAILEKPFPFEDLMRILAALVQGAETSRASAPGPPATSMAAMLGHVARTFTRRVS